MKRIPPAIQEDYRYLKFEVKNGEKDLGSVVDAVWSSALNYMGAEGASDADIWIIGNKFDEEEQIGVVKVKNNKVDSLRAAITVNNGFEDECFLSIVDVSGTLSGLKD